MKTPVLLILAVASVASAADVRPLLDAIAKIESGNREMAPRWDVNGMAIGPYQIHPAYAKDAGRDWKRCREREYARETVLRYWKRYCPRELAAGNYEALARVHNGGPAGARIAATKRYWAKVRAATRGTK